MSSIKECTLAFFKGLAFGKGLIIGRELAENKDMAEDRWITIHPWGMSQGEADAGEGKGYYRRIFIDDETGEIEKGLGAGTNIKDLSKTLKAKKNGEETETTSKTVTESTGKSEKPKSLPQQIKASQRDIEAEKKNQEFLDKAEKDLLPTAQYKYASEKFISENKDTAKEYLDKYSDDKNISDYIKKSYRQDIISGGSGYFDQVVENLKDIDNYPNRKAKYEEEKAQIIDKLTDYENKLNAIDLKDRRKTKYLNDIKNIKNDLDGAYRSFDVP